MLQIMPTPWGSTPDPDPEAQYSGLQDRERLTSALAALPIEQRECLVLCELEQLSYKDIARITQVPIGTVMSRIHAAREKLQAELDWDKLNDQ